MPESAIASGCVDLILSPEDIAKEIVRIARTTARGEGFHPIEKQAYTSV